MEQRKLYRIKDGEIIQEIEVTSKNLAVCKQMAREKKNANSRMWFFSDESGIPVSERTASKAIQSKIDELNEREANLSVKEQEFAEFKKWQESQKAQAKVEDDKPAEPAPKRGRPAANTESKDALFETPKQ